jgi:hypothetical protein
MRPRSDLSLRVNVVCCSCGVRAATIPRYFKFAQQVERAKAKGLHGAELIIYVRALLESYVAKEKLNRAVLVSVSRNVLDVRV